MAKEHTVQRYAGYFRGWCQAFGEHNSQFEEDNNVLWLFCDAQVGLILTQHLRRIAYQQLLVRQRPPPLLIGVDFVQAGSLRYDASSAVGRSGLESLRRLFDNDASVHLYLTYHFMYPRGTRIVTFSRRTPLPLVYKPIAPLVAKLV
jgi:hypothetical protein